MDHTKTFDWNQIATKGSPDSSTQVAPPSEPIAANRPALEFPQQELPAQFGDYELLAEIARGGMGVVYKARQTKLNRVVALKMILAGPNASTTDVERFFAEAEAAAKLDHPGIVPIFEIGQHQGQNFFSMAFIEGESLAARVAIGPLPQQDAAELTQRVAEAIDFAHRRGVVHRDLKPANVLLDPQGVPRVTDFGLAKNLTSESNLTASGSVMGTPSFMPPEQASGGAAEAGPLADVYSLGAMLYCLLTGRPPFQAATAVETLRQVLVSDPVPPRRLNPQISKDLETICLKCLEKSPSRRFASAAELANDLGRFLRNEPIRARPPGVLGRGWRWCKRNKVTAFWMGAFALSLLYPLLIGLVAMGSFAFNHWSLLTAPKPRGGLGGTVGILKDGVFHTAGIAMDREEEAEKTLEWAELKAVVYSFRAGRIDDEHFYSGGVIKVWAETEDIAGKKTRRFEDYLDLRGGSDVAKSKSARVVLMRGAGQKPGTENWTFFSTLAVGKQIQTEAVKLKSPVAEYKSTKTEGNTQTYGFRDTYRDVPVLAYSNAQEFLDSLADRSDYTAEEKELLRAAVRSRPPSDLVVWSSSYGGGASRGALVSSGDTQLYEHRWIQRGLNPLRVQAGLPPRPEGPELFLRIKCRLLSEEEIKQAQADGKLSENWRITE